MALTANLTTITITGSYVDVTGAAIAGQVTFTPRAILKDSVANQIIIPNTVYVTLNAQGAFSVILPATDDTSVSPTNFTYLVEEAFPNGATYDITVPQGSVGGTIDLADLSPALPAGGDGSNYVTINQYNTASARLTALETIRSFFDALITATTNAETATATSKTAVEACFDALDDIRSEQEYDVSPMLFVGRVS